MPQHKGGNPCANCSFVQFVGYKSSPSHHLSWWATKRRKRANKKEKGTKPRKWEQKKDKQGNKPQPTLSGTAEWICNRLHKGPRYQVLKVLNLVQTFNISKATKLGSLTYQLGNCRPSLQKTTANSYTANIVWETSQAPLQGSNCRRVEGRLKGTNPSPNLAALKWNLTSLRLETCKHDIPSYHILSHPGSWYFGGAAPWA